MSEILLFGFTWILICYLHYVRYTHTKQLVKAYNVIRQQQYVIIKMLREFEEFDPRSTTEVEDAFWV